MKYGLIARNYPAMLSSIPFVIFQYYFMEKGLSLFLNYLTGIKWIGEVTIYVVGLYLISLLSRYIGRSLFEDKYFNKGNNFPTTKFLLYSDDKYSKYDKKLIRKKIKKDFHIILPTKFQENKNEIDARKRIKEAVALIRNKVGNGKLLIQHNIEYGFWRNLIGGAVIGLAFSIINIMFSSIQTKIDVLYLSIFLLSAYSILIIFSRKIIEYHGNIYAKILFTEYLSINK